MRRFRFTGFASKGGGHSRCFLPAQWWGGEGLIFFFGEGVSGDLFLLLQTQTGRRVQITRSNL